MIGISVVLISFLQYNVKKSDTLIKSISDSSNLMNKDNLTVCRSENVVGNENAFCERCGCWDCCFEKSRCEPDDYFISLVYDLQKFSWEQMNVLINDGNFYV